jgi:capsular polysaccharide biosynthesis protein
VALNEDDKHFSDDFPAEFDVLFIQRTGSREIINMKDLQAISDESSLRSVVLDLEEVSFADQLSYLYYSACLVASAGTATHNMLFMRPGSTMVVVMQAEWCESAWMYVNQGTLLGIRVHILCSDKDRVYPVKQSRHSSFVNKFWKQGSIHFICI